MNERVAKSESGIFDSVIGLRFLLNLVIAYTNILHMDCVTDWSSITSRIKTMNILT